MRTLTRRQILRGLAAGAAGVGAFGRGGHGFAEEAPPAPGPSLVGGGVAEAAGEKADLTGRIVLPGDPDYDEARQLWDRLYVTYPLVVVFAQDAQDVRNAVSWSRQNGVSLRARSGRHALEGWSSLDGGVVVDVSDLKDIVIDTAARRATVGAGVTQGELVAALGQVGHAIPSGSEASVGIAGVTLGGGIGYLSRSLGATCDNLLSLDIVVPSGDDGARLVRVTERRNSDLLWASRGGGGGNFGIATSFTFRIHPVSEVAHFLVKWDWSDPGAAFDAWQRWAPHVDSKLGSTFVFLPKASNSIEAEGIYQGSAAGLQALLQPLLAVGTPTVTITPTTWAQWFHDHNAGPRQFANWRFSSSWAYRELPAAAVEAIISFMTSAPAPACNYWCLSWGGAARDVPRGGTAFYHREPLFYAEPGAGWNDPAQTGPVAVWLAQFRQALRPFVRGAYVNVPDAALQDWGTEYYGTNYARLRQVKQRYDPTEVFQFPQSIPPA